ncbi:hypothetical protein GCK72_018329 [Caenorhabditis remanei]|uniref:Uncharacterized protein n=1 Tax=Caenorhabditis remanei TaxID=31234 RepID=A0A6A5GAV8_CAERE|nr:hypothetical protein GCK72_018329 [Caenorhabditis remanei]KAF1751775.1 hypothetical protein GCK72_018329 [Caenorhabditis remanei]
MVVASRRLRQITSSRSLPATPGETQRRRLQAKLSRTRQIVTQLQQKFTLPIPAQAKREDLIILIFKRSSKMNFLESQARISTSRIKGGQDRDFQVTTTLPPADEEQANKMSSRRHSTSSGSTKIQINVDLTKFGKTVGSLQGQSNDFKRSRQKDSIHRHGINQSHTRRRRNNELEEEAEPKIKKSVNLLRTRGSWTSKEVKLSETSLHNKEARDRFPVSTSRTSAKQSTTSGAQIPYKLIALNNSRSNWSQTGSIVSGKDKCCKNNTSSRGIRRRGAPTSERRQRELRQLKPTKEWMPSITFVYLHPPSIGQHQYWHTIPRRCARIQPSPGASSNNIVMKYQQESIIIFKERRQSTIHIFAQGFKDSSDN